ncbi:HAMP domain-containing protein [Nakamurella sp. YIM 132087]|uniref:histidine kinase n=2 Tax=Nakamurella alba TaxID=2665158 RepID=A0A7K1FJK5_9ACTN|nr:HAMP domain-containing protein [Nakamurella alba]
MLLTLTTVGFTLGAILLNRVEHEVAAGAEQEVNEFTQFAGVGIDPDTGAPFTDIRDLIRTHLQNQYPNENELLFGWSNGLIRQSHSVVGDPLADPAIVAAVVDAPGSVGTVPTAGGDMYWNKQVVRLPGGNEQGAFVSAYLVDREEAEVFDTIGLIAAVSAIALLFSCLVAWVVAGRILEPIRWVRQTAEEITEKRISRRIPVRGRDDIAELSRTFNDMLDRLDAAFATQRQFVDDAGHELRTPITIVRGHLEVMGDDPEDREETMQVVSEELDRMNRIVDDLLVLARAEQPDFVRPAPTSLAELTAGVHTKVQALGDRRWVLEAIGDEEVEVDVQRITQAMVQLAQNAVQHTASGDTIRIGAISGPDSATFWVSDNGPGVPEEDLDVIFGRFSRGSTGGAQDNTVGAGLGLSIVAAIAHAHHGRVWVRNNHGGGARFGIDVPVAAAAAGGSSRPAAGAGAHR